MNARCCMSRKIRTLWKTASEPSMESRGITARDARSIQWSCSLERWNMIFSNFGYFGIVWTFSFCVYFWMDFLVSCHESQIKHIDFRKDMSNGRIARSSACATELLGKVWRQWQTIKLLFWEGCSKALRSFVFNILYHFIISCFFNMTPTTQWSHKDATARKLQKHTLARWIRMIFGTPPDRFNDCWCQSQCFNHWPHSISDWTGFRRPSRSTVWWGNSEKDLSNFPMVMPLEATGWRLRWAETIKEISKIARWSFKRLEAA